MNRHGVRTICGVCAGQGEGFAYSPPGRPDAEILWTCSAADCREIARNTHHMTQERFNRIEAMAVEESGNVAGQFLDGLGKTDLATMTREEWDIFCRTMIDGYRTALRETMKDEAPF